MTADDRPDGLAETAPEFPGADAARSDLRIVAIGASAGGLDAIETFFENLPAETGCAYVLIQHLSPEFRSHMPELLGRKTALPVRIAREGLAVLPNTITLIPPRTLIDLEGDRLHLRASDPSDAPPMPINTFFTALARAKGSDAVAVVLSGSGTDGADGCVAVRQAGGLVLIQDPATAQFEGMPRSVEAKGAFDLILPPETMPEALANILSGLAEGGSRETVTSSLRAFQMILERLMEAYSVDFSHYRQSTILRRVRRRLELTRVQRFEEYLETLADNSVELETLYRDLLIGVTQFFRDPLPFSGLEQKALPEVIERARETGELRVWVAGCASGEEVYSLAILIDEQIERLGVPLQVRIFATDLHGGSLQLAASGCYPETSLGGLSPGRRERYFQREKGGYQVIPSLRQMVIFTRHNLLSDPPFTDIDLVSCRNLLIYLNTEAQDQAIARLHFALREGGIMFLGSSERPGRHRHEFDLVVSQSQLYRKRRDIRLVDLTRPFASSRKLTEQRATAPTAPAIAQDDLTNDYDALLERFAPPGFLIRESGEIIHGFGNVTDLVPLHGRTPFNLLRLLPAPSRIALHTAMVRAKSTGHVRDASPIVLDADGTSFALLDIQPLSHKGGASFIVVFLRQPPVALTPSATATDALARDEVDFLKNELQNARSGLEHMTHELGTRNEELQATNEELVAANEELQSTNEELQSVNEELHTVNREHQRKIADLQQLSNDMDNLLASTDIGVVFVDADGAVRKFTPDATRFFRLTHKDIGRSLSDFRGQLEIDDIDSLSERVSRTGEPVSREVLDKEGRAFLLRILPYLRDGLVGHGTVLTFIDISELAQSKQQLRLAQRRAETAIAASGGGIFEHNVPHDTQTYCSPRWAEILGLAPEDLPPPEQTLEWTNEHVHPDDRKELFRTYEAFIEGKIPGFDVQVRMQHGDGSWRWIHGVSQALERNSAGRVTRVAGMIIDITEPRQNLEEIKRLKAEYEAVVEDQTELINRFDEDTTLTFVNGAYCSYFGTSKERQIGWKFIEVLPEQERDHFLAKLANLAVGDTISYELEVVDGGGRRAWLQWNIRRLGPHTHGRIEFQGVGRDVTTELSVRSRLESVIATVTDGIVVIDSLGAIQTFNQAAERTFGYAGDEVIGRNVRMLMPEAHARAHDHHLSHYLTTGERRIIGRGREVEGRRKDGTTFPLRISVGEARDRGEPIFVGLVQDLTEDKAKDAALTESKRRLEDAFYSMRAGVAFYDADDCLVLCNQIYRDLFLKKTDLLEPGVSYEAIVREAGRRGQYADMPEACEPWIQAHLATHRRATAPFEVHLDDGRWIRALTNKTSDGGTIAIAIDISEQKAADRRLQKTQARLEDVLTLTNDWLWETDRNHRISFLSDSTGPGVGRAGIQGQTLWEIAGADPESDPHWRRQVDSLEARQPFRDLRLLFRHAGDQTVERQVSGRPLFTADGHFIGFRGTAAIARCAGRDGTAP